MPRELLALGSVFGIRNGSKTILKGRDIAQLEEEKSTEVL